MARQHKAEKPETTVVEGTGAASVSRTPGVGNAVEAAMSQAVQRAYADGISNPDDIRAAMMAAREKALRGVAAPEPTPAEPPSKP